MKPSEMANVILKTKISLNHFRFIHTTRSFGDDFSHLMKTLGAKFKLSDIDRILSSEEEYVNIEELNPSCPVKEIFVNKLGANTKIEDRWNIAMTQIGGSISGLIACVVDGHSGKDCAQIVNHAGLEYMAASCLTPDNLRKCIEDYTETPHYTILRRLHPTQWETLNDSVNAFFKKSLFKYMDELLQNDKRIIDPNLQLKDALMRLDKDLCIPSSKDNIRQWLESRPLIRLTLSGAVALFLRLHWHGEEGEKNPTLHIANVGDCFGVIATQNSDTSKLEAIPLNTRHNIDNEKEQFRIAIEHKDDDPALLFREGRLLGEIQCFRSFGDVRYKWPVEWLNELYSYIKLPGNVSVTPTPYKNPPYLTAEPDIFRFVINPKSHKFLVIGTDGLWDVLTPEQVIDIVQKCPKEQSPATLLLKHALSGYSPNDSFDVQRLSMHLALKPGVARFFRDDITIMVLKL